MNILIINLTILTTLINFYILLKIAQAFISIWEKRKLVKRMEKDIGDVKDLVEEAIKTAEEK
jgi:uncharacterized protein YggT (Ycf19 family)